MWMITWQAGLFLSFGTVELVSSWFLSLWRRRVAWWFQQTSEKAACIWRLLVSDYGRVNYCIWLSVKRSACNLLMSCRDTNVKLVILTQIRARWIKTGCEIQITTLWLLKKNHRACCAQCWLRPPHGLVHAQSIFLGFIIAHTIRICSPTLNLG